MSQEMTHESYSQSVSLQLKANIVAALRVAGPPGSDGQTTPLSSAQIQRKTGIARSTLRALKNVSSGEDINPDLSTLTKLADELGIPVAFLLMRPQDWESLSKAINGLGLFITAAGELNKNKPLARTDVVEKVLRACGVHPDLPPIGASDDKGEMIRLEARNEWRRRTSYVLGALMLSRTRDHQSLGLLTAIAASLTNQTTPNNPRTVQQREL